jgi:hypothetical protein
MTSVNWVGRACPKCTYVRTGLDRNPAWQCPSCHVAYAKFVPQEVVAHGRAMAGEARSDRSLFVLIVVNVIVLAVAVATRMDVRGLMLVYWLQSVIIGVCTVVRILGLGGFSARGLVMNGRPVPQSEGAKVAIAGFFAAHYGVFHFAYLGFLVAGTSRTLMSYGPLLACGIAFLVNHLYSLGHNMKKDAAGAPHIGMLMFLPYARVIPMHATILFALAFPRSIFALLLFGVLKIAADALMHTVEHHVLKGRPAD